MSILLTVSLVFTSVPKTSTFIPHSAGADHQLVFLPDTRNPGPVPDSALRILNFTLEYPAPLSAIALATAEARCSPLKPALAGRDGTLKMAQPFMAGYFAINQTSPARDDRNHLVSPKSDEVELSLNKV
jgi:hypothetical protein